jgi:hypothetical protein
VGLSVVLVLGDWVDALDGILDFLVNTNHFLPKKAANLAVVLQNPLPVDTNKCHQVIVTQASGQHRYFHVKADL